MRSDSVKQLHQPAFARIGRLHVQDTSRIQVADSLRGFALLGILFIHMMMFFLAGPFTPELNAMAVESELDSFLRAAIYWIALSKFYSIFAILFGFSFYIQLRNAKKRELDYNGLFLWRMAILAAFGLIHWSYYPGDILMLYALVGVLLLPLSYLSNRALLIIAAALFVGLGRTVYFALNASAPIIPYDWSLLYGNFVNAALNGSFLDVAQTSYARMVIFWDEHINLWGRLYNTLSYFLLGFLVGRLGWLEDLDLHIRKFKIALIVSLGGTLLFGFLHIKFIGGAWDLWSHSLDTWHSIYRFGIFDFFSLSLSVFYASGFILSAYFARNRGIFRYLSSYGRTALTSFVTQSALSTFIFFNWGLGLIHKLNVSECLYVFVIVATIQITFSHLWLERYKYGPLEWVWRSLTYRKWVTNQKEAAQA